MLNTILWIYLIGVILVFIQKVIYFSIILLKGKETRTILFKSSFLTLPSIFILVIGEVIGSWLSLYIIYKQRSVWLTAINDPDNEEAIMEALEKVTEK